VQTRIGRPRAVDGASRPRPSSGAVFR
jgi:hypothetical protein